MDSRAGRVMAVGLLLVSAVHAGQMSQSVRWLGAGLLQVNVELADTSEGCRAVLVPAADDDEPRIMLDGTATTVHLGARAVAGGIEVRPLVIEWRKGQTGSSRAAVRLEYATPPGPAFVRTAMGGFVAARAGMKTDGTSPQAGYLIIVPDEFYSNVLPLADWKERRGFKVWVRKTSETGGTRELIKAYIQDAYLHWSPAPSYVLLVGSINKMPAFTNAGTPCVTDHPYACVDGDDFLADLFVGRFPSANTSELDVMVAKTIGYESNPHLADTLWYHRALMVGTSYQEGGTPAVTALVTKRLIRERLLGRGFSQIDTVFYPPTASGRGTVDTAVNRGVLFVNGRGWGNYEGWRYPQFLIADVAALANGWKLPVVTSIYCGTGNYQANPCFGETWLRAGVPTSPRGAVAFWGSSYTGTSTRWNNSMDYGIYEAVFDNGVRTCGPAMYSGKLTQYENFPLPCDSQELRTYFHVYNLLGDPGLEMWTAVPRQLSVGYSNWVPVGTSEFSVTVQAQGAPVPGAQVCLFRSGGVQAVEMTDAGGVARFSLDPLAEGTVLVTVTGANLAPHLGQFTVGAASVWVGHLDHSPLAVGPGQSVGLIVTIQNFGNSQSATGVSATLRSMDVSAVVTDSVRSYSDIAPGGAATAAPFGLWVAASCTSRQRVRLALTVSTGQGTWASTFEIPVQGPTFQVTRHAVHDANGWLDPGETSELSVVILNRGNGAANGLTGVLRSLNPNAVSVVDSLGSFGSVAAGDSGQNTGDRFTVHANAGVGVGRRFTLRVVLRTSDGAEVNWDFPVTVGEPIPSAPLGPDHYGYYAYDDTDAGYGERPSYDWVEVDPNYGGSGTRLSLTNDTCMPVGLPFNFRFYGRDNWAVSVSDNGFLAPGSQWIGDIYNWRLPSPSGTDGTIAAFWDDFRTDTLGASGVYTYHDAANHRFIIEWSRCVHVHGFRPPSYGELQSFEAVLLDPQFYPTRTGDAPVVFQYLMVVNDDTIGVTTPDPNCHNYATVGIESPDNSCGLEYTYANSYPAAAAVVANGRAIRFTTNPPDTFVAVAEMRDPGLYTALRVVPRPAVQQVRIEAYPAAEEGRVSIYDVGGRMVTRFTVGPGDASHEWRLVDLKGQRVRAGVYQAVLTRATDGTRISADRIVILEQP